MVVLNTHINILFFFNDTATTEIYTLSLHDALPILQILPPAQRRLWDELTDTPRDFVLRSEEHTSELQSHLNIVCRLLLEKKKNRHSALLVLLYPFWVSVSPVPSASATTPVRLSRLT